MITMHCYPLACCYRTIGCCFLDTTKRQMSCTRAGAGTWLGRVLRGCGGRRTGTGKANQSESPKLLTMQRYNQLPNYTFTINLDTRTRWRENSFFIDLPRQEFLDSHGPICHRAQPKLQHRLSELIIGKFNKYIFREDRWYIDKLFCSLMVLKARHHVLPGRPRGCPMRQWNWSPKF